jgi:hypothetical protein
MGKEIPLCSRVHQRKGKRRVHYTLQSIEGMGMKVSVVQNSLFKEWEKITLYSIVH